MTLSRLRLLAVHVLDLGLEAAGVDQRARVRLRQRLRLDHLVVVRRR